MIACPSCGSPMSQPAPPECAEPDRHANPRVEAATAWLFRYIMRSERRPPRDVTWPDDCPEHFRENWRRAAADMLAAIDGEDGAIVRSIGRMAALALEADGPESLTGVKTRALIDIRELARIWGGDSADPARREALDLICRIANARYEKVNVPVAIRDALLQAPRGDQQDAVLEAIGVLCGAPYNTFEERHG